MPVEARGPIREFPKSVADLDRLFRNFLVSTDPNTVGPEELKPEAVTTEKVAGAPAASDDRFYVKRAGELVFDTLLEPDFPPEIARDTEVAQAITDHEAAADPHPVYTDDAEAAAIAAAAVSAHEGASDPHPTYTTAAELAAALSALNLASGTYTPTLTNVANLDASTAYQCQYLRVGAVVTVSGKVDVDPTAGAATQLGISLPIASNLGAAEDCAGTAFASGVAGQGAAILGDAANNRAEMNWVAVDTTNKAMYFTFQYEII